MATLFVCFGLVVLIATAILQLMRRLRISCWLLALLPGCLCLAALADLSRGVRNLGQASFDSDVKTLVFSLSLLAVGILAGILSRWRWLFWIVWISNAFVCGILIYLTFFWHVFS